MELFEELHHETSHRNSKSVSHSILEKPNPGTYLDDTHNQLIAGRSALANTITFFETGYLIYDTSALLYSSCLQHNHDSILRVPSCLAKDPVSLVHHLALISLAYLQTYIAAGRRRAFE